MTKAMPIPILNVGSLHTGPAGNHVLWGMAMAKVLYVEDNFENRLLVSRVLTAEGHQVLEAADGMEGLRVAQEKVPDLILLDINLPEMDGYEVTARMRSIPALADVPIVALTANVLRGDRERSLQAGCDGYIPKPLDVDMLPKQVEVFLHHASHA